MSGILSPIQAVTNFVGKDIIPHEDLCNAAFKKINAELPKLFLGEYIGIERQVFVHLPGITQAALLEVVLKYREIGWSVRYGIDFSSPGRLPMVTITIPSE